MQPDPQIPDWMERLHSGKATPDELVQLRNDPAVDPVQLESECQLNRLLDTLPAAPVSTNLASRVLDALHLEEQRRQRDSRRSWVPSWMSWRPVWTSLALGCVALTAWRIQSAQRTTLARNVLVVSQATTVPGVDTLADFEAIEWLESRPEPGDLELMAALTTP
jgi:hypothetical protein